MKDSKKKKKKIRDWIWGSCNLHLPFICSFYPHFLPSPHPDFSRGLNPIHLVWIRYEWMIEWSIYSFNRFKLIQLRGPHDLRVNLFALNSNEKKNKKFFFVSWYTASIIRPADQIGSYHLYKKDWFWERDAKLI